MAELIDPKNIDKRLAERYLKRGLIDDKAFDRHVKGLPDVAEKSVICETIVSDDVEDEDDETEDAPSA
jgi:hypothetical protein